jgi:hypothetical protein
VSKKRAAFGSVDRLPSGRYRARYVGPDGRRRTKVFGTAKADAWAWLSTQQADLVRKSWRAPEAGRRTVAGYEEDYLARDDLRESTAISMRRFGGTIWPNPGLPLQLAR